MSYVVLARKYRPKNFDQIVGQEHVSKTLKNAISENRVAHAYLFSGPRGVGKTTTARILAKSLNCKQGPTHDPCGHCPNCVEIAAGTSVDVQEIDGASNRGIDEIRALRDNVKFAPASSKYKIYIIDEAHQITDAAFNALLKTLEEPPEHVVFILATTESQKIPLTILSRCQRYRFRLLSSKEIMDSLQRLVEAESFRIEPAALQTITTSAGGSLRDALSMLDQAVSFVSGEVKLGDMQSLLGFLPKEIIYSTIDALSKNDSAKLLSIIKEISEQGYSLLQYARDLREHLRYLMILSLNSSVLEVTPDELKELEKRKTIFSVPWLIRSGHMLSRALDELRWSEQPRLVLELHMLRLAQPFESVKELIERIESLEKNVSAGGYSVSEPAPEEKYEAAAPAPSAGSEPKPSQPPARATQSAAPSDIARMWQDIVRELKAERPRIGNMLDGSLAKSITGNNFIIGAVSNFQQDGIKNNQAVIEDAVEKKAGRRLGLQIQIVSVKPQETVVEEEVIVEDEAVEAPIKEVFQVEADLTDTKGELPKGINKVLNKFPGKVVKKSSEKPA
ncbi:MAG TPA: DNA polymerase III subunit gamma/tau [Elusimicrobia bacterium]|nr:MAG: DNA polymerase III, subunit gamma and tau [Elusimicrobia bacterium RIFOXYA12_FULL_49_49]OGS09916.1 MAG: DNA polymerase III, subunit gamma and tau [Elusimicrobia bacterium RIFOXYB1_FULL_48_9]OGS15441.1 MAG: DNA polymerase III, subunit gamma and tau [Elusimicrobia bacterium RIFOXYA2_FULL_47_53]OGS30868.1 MAG: DNA polymerase III, subunit gamma and tau [Elusimicrobia bacterium RIFOXYB2_FULL_46_23]HBU69156.1 DNA polymerase III subunit gamma/tau [Elusimicrobiota bacterium]